MARTERLGIIDQIERARNSRLVCYLTGDRPGMEARIGMDIFPYFYDVLVKMGKQRQLDLFIYSAGGATMAAWGLVNLLREFCDKLCVLVPSKAQSSATLISLGADEIVMSRMGQLSPVDPSTNSLQSCPPGSVTRRPTAVPTSKRRGRHFLR